MYKCFLVSPTGEAAMYLRRYAFCQTGKCAGPMSYHNAQAYVKDVPVSLSPEGYWSTPDNYDIPHDDPRWPTRCACGYRFQPGDEWQFFHDRIDTDGVARWGHRDLPVGAMFFANWMPKNMVWDNKEDDHLHVVTPGGLWNVDARASNCTMPNDRLHRCWVRVGVPPLITVSKAGLTCAAGAGSIACGNYHGFLRNGSLTPSI